MQAKETGTYRNARRKNINCSILFNAIAVDIITIDKPEENLVPPFGI